MVCVNKHLAHFLFLASTMSYYEYLEQQTDLIVTIYSFIHDTDSYPHPVVHAGLILNWSVINHSKSVPPTIFNYLYNYGQMLNAAYIYMYMTLQTLNSTTDYSTRYPFSVLQATLTIVNLDIFIVVVVILFTWKGNKWVWPMLNC